MKKLLIALVALFCVLAVQAQEKFIARIMHPTDADYKEFVYQQLDIAAYSPGILIDLVVDQEKYDQLASQGYSLKITMTEKQLKENLSGGDLPGYRSYASLLTELQNIEAAHPTICKLYDIGDSRGKEYTAAAYNNYKHDIWAMKISDNVATEEDEPCIFYFGNHHAREPISLEVAMYFLNYIVTNYGTDPDITNSVNNKQIWFVPLVNPNGHKIVWDNVDLWWRKNIRDNNNSNTINTGTIDGVDLNRNYAWQWGGQGTSSDPTDITYCGPDPASEPEVTAIQNFLEQHHFVAGITYHSYSELVLFPYGYETAAFAPDHNSLQALAVSMANTIPAEGGGYYTPDKSSGLYPASGTTDDQAYGKLGIFCYTIELGTEFIPPSAEILGICQGNLQAAKILLNRVNQSTLTGLVKDASTNLPVVAEVYISGIDNTGAFREPYMSDAAYGRYYRFLQNANYTVTFSAYGYIPQTFTNVNINSTGQTILNVNLVQALSVTVTGTVTDLATGLHIEGATVQVMDTPITPVTTNAQGQYTITSVMEGTYNFRVSKINYATIIQSKNVSVANHVFDFQLQESTAWSFEGGVFEPQWTFSGNVPWYITNVNPYDGLYCSRSGAIGHNQVSEMSIALYITTGGDISFYRKVSSEASYDFLKFYIDGVQQGSWSGELAWAQASYPVTAGVHTFKWAYSKDVGVVSGSDCAWVDYIQFPSFILNPQPAEIFVDPLSVEVTVPPNSSVTEQVMVSNLGDYSLDYNIYKQAVSGQDLAYCTASGGCDEYITNVVFNTISNNSGTCSSGGYANYTNLSTNVNVGQTYSLTITIGNYYSGDDIGVWIDWNKNESFTDAGENVVCATNVSATNTYSITIPQTATQGATRMRIRMKYTNTDCGSSCGTASYGEVEDYTLNVIGNVAPWLTISPLSGTVTGQNSQVLDLTFNSTGLSLGDYAVNMVINSNDPDEPSVIVPCVMHVASGFDVNLTAMLEGPFSSTEMTTQLNSMGYIPLVQPYSASPWNYAGTESVSSIPNSNVVDWVLLELRDAVDAASATASTAVARRAVFMLKNGNIVHTDGTSLPHFTLTPVNNLFGVIWQRNHLGIMSANPLSYAGNVYSYNFSTSASQVFGGSTGHKEIATGIWGMVSGDGNADGAISNTDKTNVWQLQAGQSGYRSGDFNMNGQVENADKNDNWRPNSGRGEQVP